MKLLSASAFLTAVFAAPAAWAFGIGADFGYDRLILQDDADVNGFGGDFYIRPLTLPVVDPELQLGLHHFKQTDASIGTVSTTLIPLLAGARANIPVVPIFFGAHLGTIGTHNTQKFPGEPAGSYTNWRFGFSLGGGFTFLDLELLKLGVSAWYYIIPLKHDLDMLTIALDVSLGI